MKKNKLKFRVWDEKTNEYWSEDLIKENILRLFYPEETDFDARLKKKEYYSSLRDKNGVDIFEGDVLKFEDENGIWQCPVVFTRGVFGLDTSFAKQIKNPEDWDKDYDKIKSRWWSVEWGYEEYGEAFTYRKPLSKNSVFTGNYEDYAKSELKKLYEKFDIWADYVLAEIVGNINENPELKGN